MAGAPLGNTNSAKGRKWADALHRALVRYEDPEQVIAAGEALNRLAMNVVAAALRGDKDCIWEIANRLDGKPAQAVTVSGDEENPLQHNHTVKFIGDR